MEALRLSESEINFYFNAFDDCDVDKSGKLTCECVKAFLSRSGLPSVVINDIMQLSDPSASELWGRVSFFTALKFIALAQCGLPVSRTELMRNRENLPLPVFNEGLKSREEDKIGDGNHACGLTISENSSLSSHKQYSSFTCHGVFSESQASVPHDDVTIDETDFHFAWPKCYGEEEGLLNDESTKQPDNFASFDNDKKYFRSSDWFTLDGSIRKSADCSSSSRSSSTITSQDSNSSNHLANPMSFSAEGNEETEKLHDADVWGYQDLSDCHSSDPLKKIKHRIGSTYHSSQNSDFRYSIPKDNDHLSMNNLQINEVCSWRLSHSRSSSFPLSQYNGSYYNRSEKRKERRRKWLESFALQSKRESEYASQFDELFISKDTASSKQHLMVTHAEVTQLFTAQYKISPADFDQIWFIADINRDNYLDKYEFCLASHLAHLFGRRDLSLEDAVIACKPYIRKINKRLAQTQTYGNHSDYFDDEHLCTTGLLTNNKKQYSALDHFGQKNLSVSECFSHSANMDSKCDASETESTNSFYNSFENLSHVPTKGCESSARSPSSAGTVGSGSASSSSSSSASLSSNSSSHSSTSESDSSRFAQNTVDSVHMSSEKTSTHNTYTDPIRLLSSITGRRTAFLSELPSSHRRRLLSSLIREAKSVNHTLLRLNNEMQCELAELNDQRVNLSAQLQHLGLQPVL
uniref:EF-hand domain-containing protein n=3 Tax=Trichobilharzia regenti TaxID=157069 RepID=A0AA85KCC2_TRIRE|nr:unnamed protein product [Trichobilharzia regenti]